MADNQKDIASAFYEGSIMKSVGDIRENENYLKSLFHEVNNLYVNKDLRKSMSQRARSAVDGNGARRIAERLLEIKRER